MRTSLRYSLATAIAAVALSAASASAAPPAWFDVADRDRDGRVTFREYVQDQSKFAILDENGDGSITPSEEFLADGVVTSSWVYAESMDGNRSGAVTSTEYLGELRAVFAAADANGDGEISGREAEGLARSAERGNRGGRGFAGRFGAPRG